MSICLFDTYSEDESFKIEIHFDAYRRYIYIRPFDTNFVLCHSSPVQRNATTFIHKYIGWVYTQSQQYLKQKLYKRDI